MTNDPIWWSPTNDAVAYTEWDGRIHEMEVNDGHVVPLPADAVRLVPVAEVEELRRQRAAVLALHQAGERGFANGDTREMCGECDVYWPCPTATVLGVEA